MLADKKPIISLVPSTLGFSLASKYPFSDRHVLHEGGEEVEERTVTTYPTEY